jgi:hypothetical protein
MTQHANTLLMAVSMPITLAMTFGFAHLGCLKTALPEILGLARNGWQG